MTHVQKPYEFPHALWVRLAQMAPESHGIPRNPMETNGNPSRNPMEILSGIAATRCKMKPTSPGTGRFLAAPPVGVRYIHLKVARRATSSSSSSVVDGVFIQAIFSMDNALMLVYQTVGGTFPSLSQTGEGFLLQFEKPRLTLSAEEELLRACVPMRHQGKTRRACVDC